ncbi:MAG: hypothetical protein PHY82_03520 [Lentisphaeria bacterium]|mgnify:FL=1|nr:hypothetical protein [Lentisphaeria bacterium]
MESDRYLFIHLDDLIVQPEDSSAMILHACKRGTPFRVQALCQFDEELLVTLTQCSPDEVPDDVRWLDVSEVSFRDLDALLQERWKAGYEPVGTVTSTRDYDPLKRFLLVQRAEALTAHKHKKS